MPSFFHEDRLERFLRELHITFETAYNLYELPGLFELSQYATLSFHSQKGHRSRNIEKLGIQVIGFDAHFIGRVTFDPPDQIFDHPFFFPDTDPHPPRWRW